MAAANNKVYQFKLVLLGESAVGKSSLVLRFVRGQFFDYQESTIGAAFLTQTVALSDSTVKFEIWDTAGQERYHSLAPMYYRGAAAAIVVYDITSPDSFARAKSWVRELQRQVRISLLKTCLLKLLTGSHYFLRLFGGLLLTGESEHCHCSRWQQI